MAEVLVEYESTIVNVEGHTDADGSQSFNQTLSEKRAASVADYLHNNGVILERLQVVGYGELRPIADNSTANGKSANRRVEITLDPIVE